MNYAIILAGGVGSRFWPFSREFEPKQFMKVICEESLVQSSIRRLKGIIPSKNIYIISNYKYFFELQKHVSRFGIPSSNIILEPEGKNTAPAIGLCARLISLKDKNAALIVMPSDHYITGLGKFFKNVKTAFLAASRGYLVTMGIKPRYPATGYGYIKVKLKNNNDRGGRNSFLMIDKFLEKPAQEKANKYFKDRKFYWNSGIFVWKADVFLGELKKYLPGLYNSLKKINTCEDIVKAWNGIRPVSVDYGILELSKKIALIPADFSWTDLGSWDALNEIMPTDQHGNIIQADSVDLGSSGICVFSRGKRFISTIGLKDLIVADTPDALLICHKSKAQEVKKVVDYLKERKRKEHVTHVTEKRPWGAYTVLEIGRGFKIKLIEIEPKKRLSLQSHEKRAEHWVVVSGCAKVTSKTGARLVKCNQSVYIPKGTKHRLENPTSKPVKIVEVQTGNYLEEDDIKRFADDFKRQEA